MDAFLEKFLTAVFTHGDAVVHRIVTLVLHGDEKVEKVMTTAFDSEGTFTDAMNHGVGDHVVGILDHVADEIEKKSGAVETLAEKASEITP